VPALEATVQLDARAAVHGHAEQLPGLEQRGWRRAGVAAPDLG
jgi:hypothetical protein